MMTRVLVLDDQEYLREIIAVILGDGGYPALPVANTIEAVQCLEELRPEMLVLDMSLPGITGLEFLDELRRDPRWAALPVLMVSGDPGALATAQGRPNVGTLSKPFDANVLISETQRLIGPPALSRSA